MKTIATTMAALLSGAVFIEEVIPHVVNSTVPVFEDAIKWQENTVRTAEYLELSCAKLAREEWEVNKAKAIERLADYQELLNYEQNNQ